MFPQLGVLSPGRKSGNMAPRARPPLGLGKSQLGVFVKFLDELGGPEPAHHEGLSLAVTCLDREETKEVPRLVFGRVSEQL